GEPQFVQARRGNKNRPAALPKTVLSAAFLELLDDCGGVFGSHRGEEGLEISFFLPLDQRVQTGDDGDGGHTDRDALPQTQIGQYFPHAASGSNIGGTGRRV